MAAKGKERRGDSRVRARSTLCPAGTKAKPSGPGMHITITPLPNADADAVGSPVLSFNKFARCSRPPPEHRYHMPHLAMSRATHRRGSARAHVPCGVLTSLPYPTGAFGATDADADQQRDDVEQLTKLTTG